MSADSRVMNEGQVAQWAQEEIYAAARLYHQEGRTELKAVFRSRFIARAVYAHRVARGIMQQGGYLNDN